MASVDNQGSSSTTEAAHNAATRSKSLETTGGQLSTQMHTIVNTVMADMPLLLTESLSLNLVRLSTRLADKLASHGYSENDVKSLTGHVKATQDHTKDDGPGRTLPPPEKKATTPSSGWSLQHK